MSVGTRSGVNWMRANVPPTTFAKVSTARVLVTPGTPSSSTCPLDSRPTSISLDELVLADDDLLDLEDRPLQGVHLGRQAVAATAGGRVRRCSWSTARTRIRSAGARRRPACRRHRLPSTAQPSKTPSHTTARTANIAGQRRALFQRSRPAGIPVDVGRPGKIAWTSVLDDPRQKRRHARRYAPG